MNKVVVKKKSGKDSNISPAQKTFNRLKKRIETLQKECQQCSQVLDRHLDLYTKKLLPKQNELVKSFGEQIKFFYPYYQDKKNLRKKERECLKEFLSFVFKKMCDIEGPELEMGQDLSCIHEEIFGFSYKDKQNEDFELFKRGMEAQFAQKGMPIDLSNIKLEGSQQDIMEKIFESIEDLDSFLKEKQEQEKSFPKSPKEEKVLALEALQKKEIGALYKQLAKVFHPDLEIDPEAKIEKEALMKKLTAAYEEGDMHTLLSLEMRALDDSEKKERTVDQLKLYNELLKEQIEMLETKLEGISHNYRYAPLLNYIDYHWKKGDSCLHQIYESMHEEIVNHKNMMKQAQKEPLEVIQRIIIAFNNRYFL